MVLRKAIHYFVFGNFLIAFSAVALTHLSQYRQPMETGDLHLLVFVFFSTLLVYNLNLLAGMKGMRASAFRSERHSWIIKHEKFIQAFSVLSLIVCIAELTALKKDTLLFLFVPGIFALGYALPVPLGNGKIFRLREVAFVKIFLVAWVWGTFTVGLPFVQQQGFSIIYEPEHFLQFVSRAVFIFAITIPFDIRDLSYDSDKSVTTIPARLGMERSKTIALLLVVVFVALTMVRFQFGFCAMPELIALTLSAIQTAILVWMINQQRKELFYSLWMEGTMLLQWAMVMGVSCL